MNELLEEGFLQGLSVDKLLIQGFMPELYKEGSRESIVYYRDYLNTYVEKDLREMLRIIKDKNPKFFVAENVKGILNIQGGKVIELIKNDFESLGYKVDIRLLNAANYGVPQQRERVIIMGNKYIYLSNKSKFDIINAKRKRINMYNITLTILTIISVIGSFLFLPIIHKIYIDEYPLIYDVTTLFYIYFQSMLFLGILPHLIKKLVDCKKKYILYIMNLIINIITLKYMIEIYSQHYINILILVGILHGIVIKAILDLLLEKNMKTKQKGRGFKTHVLPNTYFSYLHKYLRR